MNNRIFSTRAFRIVVPLLAAILGFASSAHAEGEIGISFRVAVDGVVTIEQALLFAPCAATASSTPAPSAFCAIEASGLSHAWSFFGADAFLNDLAGRANNENGNNVYWLYFKNGEFGQFSMNAETLAQGDELLLVYNANPLRIEPFSVSPQALATTTLRVSQFGFDAAFNPAWDPADGAFVHISSGEELATDASGSAEWFVATDTPVSLRATKSGFADSRVIAVSPLAPVSPPPPPPSPLPATRTVRLVAAATSTIVFDADVVFPACAPRPGDVEAFTLFCALAASGGSPEWAWFGGSAFLNALFGNVNNAGSNNIYWLYFKNDAFGEHAMNTEEIADGDRIVLGYGMMPLRLRAATTTPPVGGTLAVDAEEFSFDELFAPRWLPAEGAELSASDGRSFAVGTTSVVVPITSDAPFTLRAEKAGLIPSAALAIRPIAAATSSPSGGGNGGGSSGSGEGGNGGGEPGDGKGAAPPSAGPDIERLLGFLDAYQHPDGSFGADLYSDWAAVAYGAATGHAAARDRLKAFLAGDALDGALLTDSERRAMALMALGVDPARGGRADYIRPIADAFDGAQFGDPALYNDDIFAIIVLARAGYAGDAILATAGRFVAARQRGNGGWEDPDITAAAIQALTTFGSGGEFDTPLAHAQAYLRSAQLSDGGWGNSFTTAWVLQAFRAAGIDPRSVVKNSKSGFDALARSQQSDGGMEDIASPLDTRAWATSYAVPAAAGKSWQDILALFTRVAEPTNSSSGAAGGGGGTGGIAEATTTPIVATVSTKTEVAGVATSTDAGAAAVVEARDDEVLSASADESSAAPSRAPESALPAKGVSGATAGQAKNVGSTEAPWEGAGTIPVLSTRANETANAFSANPSILWAGAGAFMLIAAGLWFWKPRTRESVLI